MNVFDLFAKISLDTSDYEKGLEKSKSKLENFGDGLKSVAGKIADVAKGATVAIGAASTALAGITKQSLDAVANYEQLVGGVDKIFGESSKKVQEYANQAFTTAGLSANEYMETVTGFSASLLQSLEGDTEKAADTANRAIIDMADNMNTYGSNMESIQNAYQGFAKQNYTMLDNLKLGYGGTKEEMERLIADASQMTEEMQALGVTVDADSTSFGNIINAISVMQRHLKISGTTAKEAGGTISGSVKSMKAAWQNFLTGTGSPAQFSEVLGASIGNIKKNLKEIIPRLTSGLTELADEIAPFIPELVEDTLPAIITGASSLLTGLAERLPELIETIVPALADGVLKVVNGLWDILPKIGSVVVNLAKKSIGYIESNMGQIVGTLTSTVLKILEWISDPKKITGILQAAVRFVTSFVDSLLSPQCLTKLLEAAPAIIGGIVQGITGALPDLIEGAVQIVDAIVEWFTGADSEQHLISLLDAAVAILAALGKGMWDSLTIITDKVMNIAEKIADAFGFGDYWRAGRDAMEEFGRGMESKFKEVQQQAILFGSQIWEALHPAEAWLERQEQMLNDQQHADFEHVFGGQEPSAPSNIAEYYQQQGTTEYNPFADFIGAMTYTGEKKKTNIPNNLAEYYAQKYMAPSFSDAATLGSISGDNNVNITINTTSDRPDEIGYAVSDAVDQSLAKLQAQKNRGYGYSH